jgi:fumarate reductase subunit D
VEYPIWHLFALAGGFWIALIGTFHVYLAHFAVGGGLYLVLAELYARRLGSPALLAHVKRHARLFLLVTMVAGGVTGVGIWFTIGLLSPQATSTLLKVFVYAFATEWVFFLGEIVALLVYYYGFDRMEAADHMRRVVLFPLRLPLPVHDQRHCGLHADAGRMDHQPWFLGRLPEPDLLAAIGPAHGHQPDAGRALRFCHGHAHSG